MCAAGCFLCICPVLFLYDIFIHMCYLLSLDLMPSNSGYAVKINVEGRTRTLKALQNTRNPQVFRCFAWLSELVLPITEVPADKLKIKVWLENCSKIQGDSSCLIVGFKYSE